MDEGNTPAYAGKTCGSCASSRPFWKHPRLRGEDLTGKTTRIRSWETPPLTRGRLRESSDGHDDERNTPAYAGKTETPSRPFPKRWKHPRLRGEDRQTFADKLKEWETPPLTRGRRRSGKRSRCACGNTPAYAGKTLREVDLADVLWKHPRLRGEDSPTATESS